MSFDAQAVTASLRPLVLLATAALVATGPPAAAQFVFGPPHPSTKLGTFENDLPNSVADFDADGNPDLFVSHPDGPLIRYGDGRGHFADELVPVTPALVLPFGEKWHGGATAELDGDGQPDLLIYASSYFTSSGLHVLRGLGGAAFELLAVYPLDARDFNSGIMLEPSDADGDGDTDVLCMILGTGVMLGGGEARLLLNDGTGRLTPVVVSGGLGYRAGRAVDINGDGRADVVLTVRFASDTTKDWTQVLLGLPGGGFVQTAGWHEEELLHVHDVDGDGHLDVVTSTSVSAVATHLGLGDGTFEHGPVTELAPAYWPRSGADFDGDGHLDLRAHLPGGLLGLFRGDGGGGFSSVPATSIDFGTPGVAGLVADLVPDGRPDLYTAIGDWATTYLVFPNLTYASGGPLVDLGHALTGADGAPGLLASGAFQGGDAASFWLFGAALSSPAALVVGAEEALMPWKGGVLVPRPDLLVGPALTDTAGEHTVVGHWPAGVPRGTTLAFQYWVEDAGGPAGFAASSAVRLTTP